MKNTIALKDSKKNESSLFFVEDVTHVNFSEAAGKGGLFFVRVYRRYGNSITMMTNTLQEAQNLVGQLNEIIRYGNDVRPQPEQPLPAAQEDAKETDAREPEPSATAEEQILMGTESSVTKVAEPCALQ